MECFHWGYIILPDGTISHELADLHNKLQDALCNLDEGDWDEINSYLQSDDFQDKMEAVKKILDAAGIEYTTNKYDNTVNIKLGDMTFTIEFADFPFGKWGETTMGQNDPTLCTIRLSSKLNSGNLFLTLSHELVHAFTMAYHKDVVEKMEKYYGEKGKEAFMELLAYRWEYWFTKRVPHSTYGRRVVIERQYLYYSELFYSIITGGEQWK